MVSNYSIFQMMLQELFVIWRSIILNSCSIQLDRHSVIRPIHNIGIANSLNIGQQGQSSHCVIRRQGYSIPIAHYKRKHREPRYGTQKYAKAVEHAYLGHTRNHVAEHVH